jgi:2-polyprenyl-3-methyl-5-hydroxy-6-metoxy-1,4-benzoquinol methylase
MDPADHHDTRGQSYTQRLEQHSGVWWKRALNVQAPYHWNLRRQQLGRTLDIGCGIGRNLEALAPGSVGVDHNETSVRAARSLGHTAYTWDEFCASEHNVKESFDGLLVAHVIEHMERAQAVDLLHTYLPYLRPGGRTFFICPQERGYASDATHVQFTTGSDLESLATEVGLQPAGAFSFPFPRAAGRWFTYNEFCLLSTKPA